MRRTPTRWYVSSPGWWRSRCRWTKEPEPPMASHSEHRNLRSARKAAQALLRAGADEALLLCVYPDGTSRFFVRRV